MDCFGLRGTEKRFAKLRQASHPPDCAWRSADAGLHAGRTAATVKAMPHEYLEALDVRIILGTRTISPEAGSRADPKDGWDAQLYVPGTERILTDPGISGVQSQGIAQNKRGRSPFNSHLDGSRHFLTPESVVDIQRALGSISRWCSTTVRHTGRILRCGRFHAAVDALGCAMSWSDGGFRMTGAALCLASFRGAFIAS